MFTKGQSYRESKLKSINWKYNLKIIVDSSSIIPDNAQNVTEIHFLNGFRV